MTEVVYAIGNPESDLVKIGRSANTARRLGELQPASSFKLAVLWDTEGGCVLENALHRHFDNRRVHGEWFRFEEDNRIEIISSAAVTLKAELPDVAAVLARLDAEAARVAAEDAERVHAATPGILRELAKAVKRQHAGAFRLDRIIIEEYATGRSLRDIAAEADMSPEWVRRLVRGKAEPGRRRKIA